MPIRIQCEHCQATLNVNDKMAGKRGKCPKCGGAIAIPAAARSSQGVGSSGMSAAPGSGATSTSSSGSGWGQNVRSPMDELLDEAGVKAATQGPVCPSCHAEVKPDAVICIECGYNFAVGRQMRTQSTMDEEEHLSGMTETEKMLHKAERSIDEDPSQVDEDNYGDGADSFVIVVGMLLAAGIMLAIGIGVVVLMDTVVTSSSVSMYISLVACAIFQNVGMVWLLVVAFKEKTLEGILCLFVPFYIFFYGFTRFGGLWIPTLMLTVGFLGGIASSIGLQFVGDGSV